jgi:selenocysteine-specific elongation factor
MNPDFALEIRERLTRMLSTFHADHPLRPGLEIADARGFVLESGLGDPTLAEAFLSHLVLQGAIVREGTTVRIPTYRASTVGREDADRLVTAVLEGQPTPPSVKELAASGFGLELIRAACAEGRLVRISQDIVVTPDFVSRAEQIVRTGARPPGITVSAFREALGTSRKYALPILEYFDGKGLTRRDGDVRVLRS